MNGELDVSTKRRDRADAMGAAGSTLRIVLMRELAALWLGGRALNLLLLFSVVMSVTAVLRELESQFSMIPPPEIVYIVTQASISYGLFIGLIIGADSLSGERERATLEPLLLTPASRRQMVGGKFLAALSPWPAAMIISIPYMFVLSRGDAVFGQAVILGSLCGTLLAIGFTALGMLVSSWSNSNKVSLFASLLIYILALIPTLWPGFAQKGDLGYLVQQLNPMQGTSAFLEKILVNNRTVAERFPYVVANIVTAAVSTGLLFFYAAPRLRLEGGMPRPFSSHRRLAALLLVAGFLLSLGVAEPARASAPLPREQPLQIAIDKEHDVVKAGSKIKFNTVVTNSGAQASQPLFVAMNIIQLGNGDPVDPEDWSPERTQETGPLAAGQSSELSWVVDAILEGNYMVYMTVVPQPDGADATSQPVSSPGFHLTVTGLDDANPGGVLPVAIATPLALVGVTVLVRARGRRGKPAGDPPFAE